jgi:DNA-binding CsgD family transcriptional regulator/tetratricopeptide (TPR) repeat protein
VLALLTDLLGSAPDPALAEEIYRRSDGNAFFAEELLAAARGPAPRQLPATLRDTLLARVESLEPETPPVLHAIAVGGGHVGHDLLVGVAGVDETTLLRALDDAVAHHVLVVDADAYAFRHAAFTEALYAALLPGERTRLHVRFAEAGTSAAERAAHWSAAGDVAHALPATIDAARTAQRQHAPQEAGVHWERALALWEDARTRDAAPEVDAFDLRYNAAEALNLAGRAARAAELIEQVLDDVDATTDPHLAGRLEERLGWFRARSGDEPGSLIAYERALALVPAEPPSPERSVALAAVGRARLRQGQVDEGLANCRAAVEIAAAIGATREEGAACHALGLALAASGQAELAVPELVAAASIALRSGDVADLAWTCLHLLSVGAQAGRLADGVAAVLEQAESARRLGLERILSGLLECIAAAGLLELGRWDDAELLFETVERRGPAGIEVIALQIGRGTLAVRRGELAAASEHLGVAHAATLGIQDGRMNGLVHDGLAELARLEGRFDDARRIVDDGLRIIANTGDDDMITRLALTGLLTEASIAQCRGTPPPPLGADGVARVERLLDAARRDRNPSGRSAAAEASVCSAGAEAERLDGRATPEHWEHAVAAWERAQSPYGAAVARLRLAESLFGAGRRDDAARELRAAHAVATELRAAPLVADLDALASRAQIALAAGAAGPEPPAVGGLTPRELDVLRLVAAGSTNRQIGAALFISEKTASVHVSRILAKLGVETRGQAAALAHLRGLADGPADDHVAPPTPPR